MLMQRFAVDPWRMSAADYVSAVSTAGPSLRGRALDAIWTINFPHRCIRVGRPCWKRVFWVC